MALTIFAGEAAVMYILPLLPTMAFPAHAFLDAGLLTFLFFPVLYFLMYRPICRKMKDLTALLSRVRILEGIVPICMHCHKMRTDQDVWHKLEVYLQEHSKAQLSHSLCPERKDEHYSDLDE